MVRIDDFTEICFECRFIVLNVGHFMVQASTFSQMEERVRERMGGDVSFILERIEERFGRVYLHFTAGTPCEGKEGLVWS